ncbi:hypothetical protein PYCCODRAFT_1349687, partial [Trametes coccinea BRFM310]
DCEPTSLPALVERAARAASQDLVGLPDHALFAHGGRIVDELTSARHGKKIPTTYTLHPPEIVLNEDMRIGSCWLVPQTHAQIAVVIPRFLYPTNITIDHVSRAISLDPGQAPRHMRLWGLLEDPRNRESYRSIVDTPSRTAAPVEIPTAPPISRGHEYALLAEFEYDIYAPTPIQTFQTDPRILSSPIYFGLIVLEIIDNWGGDAICLYRLRIHG